MSLSLPQLSNAASTIQLGESHTLEVTPYSIVDMEFPKDVLQVITSEDYSEYFGVEVVGRHVFVRFKAIPKGMLYVVFTDGTSTAIHFKEGEKGVDKVRFIIPLKIYKTEIPGVTGKPLKEKELKNMIGMIKAMYKGDFPPYMRVKTYEKNPLKYPLPSDLEKVIKAEVYREYYMPNAWGYVVRIEAQKDCSILENQFYALGIRAISVLQKTLKKGEKTFVFIVSERPIVFNKGE